MNVRAKDFSVASKIFGHILDNLENLVTAWPNVSIERFAVDISCASNSHSLLFFIRLNAITYFQRTANSIARTGEGSN